MTTVCIAGMHRSGTSMVVRLLNLCGLYLGAPGTLLGAGPGNPAGHWENVFFLNINEGILASLRGRWDQPPELGRGWEDSPQLAVLRREAEARITIMARHGLWGWKDPRNSLTLPFWRQLIPGLRVVACLRHPYEVARSLAARGSTSLADSMRLWDRYVSGLRESADDGAVIWTHYDAFFADPRAEIHRLLGFLGMPAAADALDRACGAISPQVRRQHTEPLDQHLLQEFPVIAATYALLCQKAAQVPLRPGAGLGPPPSPTVRLRSTGQREDSGGEGTSAATASPANGEQRTATARAMKSRGRTDIPSAAPIVSIVIPNHNGLDDLETCLRSLQDLAFPRERLEVIVVDNASTDGSVEMLHTRFPEVRVLQNHANVGFSQAVNQAVATSSADYAAFLNTDMRVDTNWLDALLKPLQETPAIACAGSLVLKWDGSEVDYFGRPDDLFCLRVPAGPPPTVDPGSGNCVPAMFASGGAMLIRRSLFEELGGFDPGYFMYHEDVDLGWRLWLQGHQVVLCPTSVVYHKGSASSARLPKDMLSREQVRNVLATFFKNLDDANLQHGLPLLLYFLLERGWLWQPARASLAAAIADFTDSLDGLIEQRNRIQAERRLTDAELFSRVPHPLAFLLEQPSYQTIQMSVLETSRPLVIDPQVAESVRLCVAEWLNAAHFIHEERLIAEIHAIRSSEIPALAASAAQNQAALKELTQQHTMQAQTLKAVSAQLAEHQQALGAASAQLAESQQAVQALSAEASRTHQALQAVSAHLAARELHINELTVALKGMQESRSWKTAQLLARLYRWFRLRRPG